MLAPTSAAAAAAQCSYSYCRLACTHRTPEWGAKHITHTPSLLLCSSHDIFFIKIYTSTLSLLSLTHYLFPQRMTVYCYHRMNDIRCYKTTRTIAQPLFHYISLKLTIRYIVHWEPSALIIRLARHSQRHHIAQHAQVKRKTHQLHIATSLRLHSQAITVQQ
jgi:hypothetical protein